MVDVTAVGQPEAVAASGAGLIRASGVRWMRVISGRWG